MTSPRLTIPEDAHRAVPVLRHCFGSSLLAVYLHGSAVSGGLRPSSDVDLMAIIDRPLSPQIRAQLVAGMLQVSGRYPAKPGDPRPLELVVFLHAAISPFAYPPQAEFLYGEWLRRDFEAGNVPGPETNPDFALVLAQARPVALPLLGPPATALLPVVPDSDIRRAIGEALPSLLAGLHGDEPNVLLTLARMWRTLATGEFVPKDVAADWAIPRLPDEPATLLTMARASYLGTLTDDWQAHEAAARRAADHLCERLMATPAATAVAPLHTGVAQA